MNAVRSDVCRMLDACLASWHITFPLCYYSIVSYLANQALTSKQFGWLSKASSETDFSDVWATCKVAFSENVICFYNGPCQKLFPQQQFLDPVQSLNHVESWAWSISLSILQIYPSSISCADNVHWPCSNSFMFIACTPLPCFFKQSQQ